MSPGSTQFGALVERGWARSAVQPVLFRIHHAIDFTRAPWISSSYGGIFIIPEHPNLGRVCNYARHFNLSGAWRKTTTNGPACVAHSEHVIDWNENRRDRKLDWKLLERTAAMPKDRSTVQQRRHSACF